MNSCSNKSHNESYLINNSKLLIRHYENDSHFALLSSSKSMSNKNLPLLELTCYKNSGTEPELLFKEKSEIFHVLDLQDNNLIYIDNYSGGIIKYDFNQQNKTEIEQSSYKVLSEKHFSAYKNDLFIVCDNNQNQVWELNNFELLVSVSNKDAIVGIQVDKLQYRNISDGSLIWESEINISPIRKDILIVSNNLLLRNLDKIYCYDLHTGNLKWDIDYLSALSEYFSWSNQGSVDNEAFFLHNKNGLPAINKISLLTGEIISLYKSENLKCTNNSKVVIRNTLVYFIENNSAYVFDYKDFKEPIVVLKDNEIMNCILTNYGIIFHLLNGEVYYKHYN